MYGELALKYDTEMYVYRVHGELALKFDTEILCAGCMENWL